MKRNFYALFALLTALSGPLVIAPPAVSKPNCVVSVQDDQSDISPAKDGQTNARFEQDHNQPPCQFMVENSPAPEDLIVLPEDFDYELFEGREACEISQHDGAKEGIDPEIAANELAEEPSLAFPTDNLQDQLCLPDANWLPNVEPWDGPAVAGIDSFGGEVSEPAVMSAANGCWAANLVARGTYALASSLSHATFVVGEEVVNGIRWVEEIKAQKARELLSVLANTSQTTLEYVADRFVGLSQIVTVKYLASIEIHQAERPFCHCWAMREFQSSEWAEAVIEEPPSQSPSGVEAKAVDEDCLIQPETLPEVPDYQLQLNDTHASQNDAIQHPPAEQNNTVEESLSIDLDVLGGVAKQAWDLLLEKAVMVDRWSRDYDFEPFSAEELEKRSSLK